MDVSELSAEILIAAYRHGYFPMSENENEIHWYNPDPRAIIPLNNYSPSKSLRNILRKGNFTIKLNTSFRETMKNCAIPRTEDDGQWISNPMIDKYCELNALGFAHSVEVYMNDELAGGLYGVHLGGAFFGESMFYKKSNASKIAFHYLIEILKKNNFKLLDTQFINENVLRYGAIEISKKEYLSKLENALSQNQNFSLL